MEKKWCVYKHTNKTNGKCYIGITCQEPNRRWKNGNGYDESPKFYNAINKYGWDGFEHEILMEDLSHDDACKAEMQLIEKFNSIKYGYNITMGGDGAVGRPMSEETKRKIGAANSGENNYWHGKHMPEYIKAAARAANLGKQISNESKNKMRLAKSGMYHFGENPNAKAVYFEEMLFSCAKEFAEAIGIGPTVVCGWLNGSRSAPRELSNYSFGYVGQMVTNFSKQKARCNLGDFVYKIEELRKEGKYARKVT